MHLHQSPSCRPTEVSLDIRGTYALKAGSHGISEVCVSADYQCSGRGVCVVHNGGDKAALPGSNSSSACRRVLMADGVETEMVALNS